MPLHIIRNDITRVKTDAIVNTANPRPVVGAGTDSAIYKAAGETKLLEARKRIGDIKPGTAVETSAYNLDAKFIIHTVCVPWTEGPSAALHTLEDCYLNSLSLAQELNCKSVAFPLIGTGAYGIPHSAAIGVAQDAAKQFFKVHGDSMEVTIVVFDQKSLKSSEALSRDIKAYIDETYVGNAVVDEYGLTPEDAREIRLIKREHQFLHHGGGVDDLEKSFSKKLFEYVEEKGIKPSTLYGGKHERYFKRQTLSYIKKNENYHPSKYVCIVICLNLGLNLVDTLDMLSRAGYTLSRSRKADVVIRACIDKGVFDYYSVNNELLKNGCEELSKIT